MQGDLVVPGRYHRAMRRLLKWVLITLGIAALVKKLRSRKASQAPVAEAPAAAGADDPADELRRKLDETREPAPATPSPGPAPEESVEERRADVHGEARAAIDEMQASSEDD